MLSLDRINAITVKEFKQLVRDRITFAMIVLIPLVQLLLFGYAINTDVRQVPAGFVNDSPSASASQLLQDIAASNVVQWRAQYASLAQAEQAITRGEGLRCCICRRILIVACSTASSMPMRWNWCNNGL